MPRSALKAPPSDVRRKPVCVCACACVLCVPASQKYVDVATESGYATRVIEVACPNVAVLELFASRNSHAVPVKTAMLMYRRWQPDDAAVVLPPYGTEGVDNKYRQYLRLISLNLSKETRDELLAAFPARLAVCVGGGEGRRGWRPGAGTRARDGARVCACAWACS